MSVPKSKRDAVDRAEPQSVRGMDLPHLRNGGAWLCKTGLPKQRMELHLGWMLLMGFSEADARTLLADTFWDCYAELRASHRWLPELAAYSEPPSLAEFNKWCARVRREWLKARALVEKERARAR